MEKNRIIKGVCPNSKLEATTVLTFKDSNGDSFGRSYDGLVEFIDGEIIHLMGHDDKFPVSAGAYVIRRTPTGTFGFGNNKRPNEPDRMFRYYEANKIL